MKKVTRPNTLSIIALSLMPLASYAEPISKGLSGSGELGFTDSSGNTVSTALFGALKMNFNQTHYEIQSTFEVDYKSENSVQTEERYLFDIQHNRFYNANRDYYSFVGGRFEKSRFEGIDLDTTYSLGLGKNIFKNEATKLTAEIGAGQQNTRYTTSSGGGNNLQSVARLKLDLAHKINSQVVFSQTLSYLLGSDQTKTESNTGFKIKVADQLNLKTSYRYRHNNNPAAGAKEVDTQTLLTLIYDY